MVLDPIPQSLPVHFFGFRPQAPTSPDEESQVLYRTRHVTQVMGAHFPPRVALDVLEGCGGIIARKDFLGEKREIMTERSLKLLDSHVTLLSLRHFTLVPVSSIGYVDFFLSLRACVSMKTHVTNRRLKIIQLL